MPTVSELEKNINQQVKKCTYDIVHFLHLHVCIKMDSNAKAVL